jgi:hypothetical protein
MQGILSKKSPVIFLILLFAVGTTAFGKAAPKVVPLSKINPVTVNAGATAPMLRAGDTCTVYLGGPPAYYIPNWIVGGDLYKSYQDPGQTCDRPYPFTIESISFYLMYLASGSIYMSFDIESVDTTDPSCPMPGSLLTISPLYQVTMDNDFYLIQITLDTPVVVEGPYFVGLYFDSSGNPEASGLVTDTIRVPCVTFNDWGEGYVDLYDVVDSNEDPAFPGRMLLYTSGTTGGSGGPEPAPAARFVNPVDGQFLGARIDLWANDASGSSIIDRAQFQYFDGGDWYDIGYDDSDDPQLRNGVDPSGSGDGLSYLWNTTGLAENDYDLRVIVSDTLGRADTATVTDHIDPTPPFPTITEPAFGQNICNGATVSIDCADEDIAYMSFERKSIPKDFSLPIQTVSQYIGGDVNGDPADSNLASNGEFGDYCSGPAAAAMAVKLWAGRGYPYLTNEAGADMSDTLVMKRLYEAMNIQENLGAYDEEMIGGLKTYIVAHYDLFDIPIDRSPTMAELYSWMGDYEYAVMVGISGTPGFWMTAAGSMGMTDAFGQASVKMADPITATIATYPIKEDAGRLWIFYDSVWREIRIMVGMVARNWTVSRLSVGGDVIGSDGWGFDWDTQSLSEDSLYFMYTSVNDAAGHKGFSSVLVQKDCTVNGIAGDVNHDGNVDAADIVYMMYFLYLSGPPPPGGYGVVDINCDNSIGVADLIYLFNYLYNGGPAPCP